MKKLTLNLGTIKGGGALNVGVNFLTAIDSFESEFDIVYIVVRGSKIEALLSEKVNRIYFVSRNPVYRVLQEIILGYKLAKKGFDNVYNIFGFMIDPFNLLSQVTCSADSNLYYRDIKFWANETPINRFIRFLIDRYRIYGLKQSKGIIVENSDIYEKAIKMFPLKYIEHIPPAFVELDSSSRINFNREPNTIYGLFLCGWQKNKQYQRIPQIILSAQASGLHLKIIFTASKDSVSEYNEFMNELRNLKLTDDVIMLGTVDKSQLKDLYNKVDIIFLLSLLESFSNNILEAWNYKVPIIMRNSGWGRSICKDSAVYVEPHNSDDIAKGIRAALENQKNLVNIGKDMLDEYPSIHQKSKMEIDFIKKVLYA